METTEHQQHVADADQTWKKTKGWTSLFMCFGALCLTLFFAGHMTATTTTVTVGNINAAALRNLQEDVANNPEDYDETSRICTYDVKFCSGGTYVSRDPKLECHFSPCPASTYVVTFSNGREGWYFNNNDVIDFYGSSFDPNFYVHYKNPGAWGIEVKNFVHNKFLGDYFKKDVLQLGIDFQVNSINFHGNEVTRSLVLKLEDDTGVGVYFIGYELFSEKGFHTKVFDIPLQEDFPAGWSGYDAQGVPKLPFYRTYGSVLRNVQKVVFTTYVPDFFYGPTRFDIQADNIFIKSANN